MPRIQPVNPDEATGKKKELFDKVKQKYGMVPNIIKTLGNSTAVLQGFMGLSTALNETSLSPALREKITLAVSEYNGCNYCTAAHTMAAKSLGLSEDEILSNRRGQAEDEKEAAAVKFARKLVETRAEVGDEDVEALRKAGYGDEQIVEIYGVTVLSIFTNYFNHIADTELDFPAAPPLETAKA